MLGPTRPPADMELSVVVFDNFTDTDLRVFEDLEKLQTLYAAG
jgi:hypothetical protein